MISATVYALVIVPVVLVALGLMALSWASYSAARIDRARAALLAQDQIVRSSNGSETRPPVATKGRAGLELEARSPAPDRAEPANVRSTVDA